MQRIKIMLILIHINRKDYKIINKKLIKKLILRKFLTSSSKHCQGEASIFNFNTCFELGYFCESKIDSLTVKTTFDNKMTCFVDVQNYLIPVKENHHDSSNLWQKYVGLFAIIKTNPR